MSDLNTKTLSVLTVPSKNGLVAIENARDAVAIEYNRQKIADAWTHRYRMSAAENEMLQSCFKRRFVYPNGECKDSEHPVLAALNDFANHEAKLEVERIKSRGRITLSIGDPRRELNCNHNCLLLDTSREDFRIATSRNEDLIPHSVIGEPTKCCVKGSQNCHYTADHGFAVHSMYDVSMYDVAQIFSKHGLRTLTVFMYFTTTLYKNNLRDPYEFFRVVPNGNRSEFVMNDESIIYSHDTATWASWHNTCGISCFDFNLIFEVVRSYGPLRVIKIARVKKSFNIGCVSRFVPLASIFSDCVMVPDMYSAVKMNFYVEQKDLNHFVVPTRIVSSVMNYIQRAADEGYKWHEIVTYMKGVCDRIRIGPNIVQEAFLPASPDEQYRIAMSLFLIGAIQRTDRTKTISEAFKYIKNYQNRGAFSDFFSRKIQKFMNYFEKGARDWQANHDLKIAGQPQGLDEYGFWFYEFHVLPVSSYRVNKVHQFTSCCSRIVSEKLPTVLPSGFVPSTPSIVPDPTPAPLKTSRYAWEHGSAPLPLHVPNNAPKTPPISPAAAAYKKISNLRTRFLDFTRRARHRPIGIPPPINADLDAVSLRTFRRSISSSRKSSVSSTSGQSSQVPAAKPIFKKFRSYSVGYTKTDPRATNKLDHLNLFDSHSSLSSFSSSSSESISTSGSASLINAASTSNATQSQAQRAPSVRDRSSSVRLAPSGSSSQEDLSNGFHIISDAGANYVVANTLRTYSVCNLPLSEVAPWHTNISANFRNGHCAMQSFYEACTAAGFLKCSPADILRLTTFLLVGLLQDSDEITIEDIRRYMLYGDYHRNNISNLALELLARNFQINVFIRSVLENQLFMYSTIDGRKIKIYHDGGHFTSKLTGGAITKYVSIFDNIDPKTHPNVLDLSCAPGWTTTELRKRGFKVFAAHYTPGLKPKPNLAIDFFYTDVSQLFGYLRKRKMKFDYIINDIGAAFNSESAIDIANNFVPEFLNDGGLLTTKTFANPHQLWKMTNWSNIELVYDGIDTTERIFKCTHKTGYNVDNFYKWYDTPSWNRPITTHLIPFQDHVAFADLFFQGKLGDVDLSVFRPNDIANEDDFALFEIEVLSGFASASKTTHAISNYKSAVFIAPSHKLMSEHESRGVKSFTPHTFFGKNGSPNLHTSYTHIIIDEAFQFDVAYISLVAHVYPNHKIVCLGDAFQTPPCNFFGKGQILTIADFGVTNNLVDVYKIPHDISDAFNKKFDWKIRTHSKIKNGLYSFKGKLEELLKSGLPIISFNHSTAMKFSDMGANSHTITTFTGSREPIVVFYIDSAAVETQLLARSQYVYTAMSRASQSLIIYGDTDVLAKTYNVALTPIFRLADVNGMHVSHTIDIPEFEDGFVPTSERALNRDVGSRTIAQTILKDVIKPVNDPTGDFINVSSKNAPPVESGFLSVSPEAIRDYERKFKVYRISKDKFAKHQLSANSKEAIDTLIKRYSKAYPVNDKRDMEYTFKELLNGLSMAIYGNEHSVHKLKKDLRMSHDYVVKRQRQYLDKLNVKLKDPTVMKEIDQITQLSEEKLQFFNKRQSKFDPAQGFDTSDKVGQGVAATSKRINVLFCGWARALLDRIRELLVKNKRNIILATHDSDSTFNDRYLEMIAKFAELEQFTCNDFSEWDASFRTAFVKLTSWLLIAAGCPRDLVLDYENFRSSWIMQYRSMWGSASLRGREKQFSGNPFTICENTIGNMALCFSIFDYEGFQFAMFKGDDSAVNCRNCKMNAKAQRILAYTGHRLKLHNSPVGEFAGWFLTSKGLFPDVLRHSAKFLDKLYYDESHFNEVLDSLQERVAAVKTTSQVIEGSTTCSAFYNDYYVNQDGTPVSNIRISTQDVSNLFYFIQNSRSIKFSELIECDMHTLKL